MYTSPTLQQAVALMAATIMFMKILSRTIKTFSINKGNTEKDNTPDENPQEPPEFVPKWKNHPIGYPRMAERIALKPETGIYRRFDALNARHLLYLQAELTIIERDLCEIEKEDKAYKGDEEDKEDLRCQYATDYQCFLEEPGSKPTPQLALIQKMHDKINQYNKALIQNTFLQKLTPADDYDLNDVQLFLNSKDMGFHAMIGYDGLTWGDAQIAGREAPDLITVHPREHTDSFSRVVAENGIHLFKYGLGRFLSGSQRLGPEVYYDSTIMKLTFYLTSAIAALIPVTSIMILNHLVSMKAKLWTIAAFNVLISICLTVFTDAKRTDVFSVNAAFAAVQVVFIASTPA